MNDNVIRLAERVSVGMSDHDELCEWLQSWLDSFKAGDYGKFRSMLLIVESADGTLAAISQSLGHLDKARKVGLFYTAAHCCSDGVLDIERLEVKRDD